MDVKYILEIAKTASSVSDLQSKVGGRYSTIKKICDEHNIVFTPKRRKGKEVSENEIKYAISQCRGDVETAKFLNISIDRYRDYLTTYNLKSREKNVNSKTVPPKQELYKLYIEDQNSIIQISKHYNTSTPTVKKWLQSYDIILRTLSEARSLQDNKPLLSDEGHSKMSNYDWMYEHYIEKQISPTEIGKMFGYKGESTPNKYIKMHNLNEVRIAKRQEKINHAIDLYYAGNSLRESCRIAKIDTQTISLLIGDDMRPGNSYPRKFKKRSSQEERVCDFLSDNSVPFEESNRSILNGKEIDIIIPEFHLGIEINGLLYHSEEWGKDRHYHVSKTNDAKKCNINLIHFWEDEINNKFDIVCSIISNKVNITRNRCYARNTTLKEVDKEEKKNFLNKNHIQGNDNSQYAFGLYLDEILISLMTFSKARFNRGADWELVRFCSEINSNVVGGFSKLLKNSGFNNVVSYSDNTRSTGDVYLNNGFTLERINEPSYFYVDTNSLKRYNRMSMTKKKLIRRYGEDFCMSLTEREIANKIGLLKVWDCGSKTWVKK